MPTRASSRSAGRRRSPSPRASSRGRSPSPLASSRGRSPALPSVWCCCRWAPLRLPLARRAQTCAVFLAALIFPGFVCALLALALWPPLVARGSRAVLLAACAWTLVDNVLLRTPWRGGRPSAWLRGCALFRACRAYFPASLHVLPAAGYARGVPHLLCVHPHGVLSLGVISNLVWATPATAAALGGLDYRVATVSVNFWLPLWRDFVLALGFIDASRRSLGWMLARGRSAVLVVGGAAETLRSSPGTADLVLRRRRGFARLALEHGARLVPAYTFGEVELWRQAGEGWPALRAAQFFFLRATGFVLPVVFGRGLLQYDFGLLPQRVPLHTVLGAPLPAAPAQPKPSRAQVDELHARYAAALAALHAAHCQRLTPPGAPVAPLRFVD